MGEARLRNKLTADNYRCEYLMYGRFHLPPDAEGEADTVGYRSKRWTSLAALEDMEWEHLGSPMGTFLTKAKEMTEAFASSLADTDRTDEAERE